MTPAAAKTDLLAQLRKAGALWSYAPASDLPDPMLIEACLRWGDVAELKTLFRLFGKPRIRQIWREKLIPDERIYPHNYYLALIFFDIKNPQRYIRPLQKKLSRHERIKQFIA